jgi:hypothetical protein
LRHKAREISGAKQRPHREICDNLYTYMQMCIYIHIYIYIAYICIYIYMYKSVCMYVCNESINVCMHKHIYI